MPYYMGCNMGFSKWRPENLHEIEYLVFHYYFVFFGKTLICIFRKSRFPVRSVFVINVTLFTSVVCYCQTGLRRKHGKCSLCNERWHSFPNQRLNHLVLLYKWNCLNTCDKNVDIIWHYIKLCLNIRKDALK